LGKGSTNGRGDTASNPDVPVIVLGTEEPAGTVREPPIFDVCRPPKFEVLEYFVVEPPRLAVGMPLVPKTAVTCGAEPPTPVEEVGLILEPTSELVEWLQALSVNTINDCHPGGVDQ
jgi:hypothetical protein